MELRISGSKAANVFRLIGRDENSASFAVGWTLKSSPHFRDTVLEWVFGERVESGEAVISLQKHKEGGGFTDIEIQDGNRLHVILEAKVGWTVPGQDQLELYRPRLKGAARERFISVSAADADFACRYLPQLVDGVGVVHLSWQSLQKLAVKARAEASGFEEKLWLHHLIQHLQEFVAMDQRRSNVVYVVSLSRNPIKAGNRYSYVDVVKNESRYYHEIGRNGWPTTPPNYVGFRYDGKLQAVHHVDRVEQIVNLSDVNPLWDCTNTPQFLYHLGLPMRPQIEVRTGNIFKNGRVSCEIDTLLSGAFPTISAAREETKRRQQESSGLCLTLLSTHTELGLPLGRPRPFP